MILVPYSKKHDRPQINWYVLLGTLQARGEGVKDYGYLHMVKQARLYSSDWTTCACGQVCSIIPRKEGIFDDEEFRGNAQPLDEQLTAYGIWFSNTVYEERWPLSRYSMK
jgi:hypothetical protein